MNNTLNKGLQLLEVLAHSDRPLGVTDLAVQLSLGKSNVHRLLQALVELGYAQKDDARGIYRASLKLWELGIAVESRLNLKSVALAAMERLLKQTRETVHLSVLDGQQVVYVHKLDSPEPVRAYSEVGGRAPAHCVATGKAILAWQPDDYLVKLSRKLQRHTPKTITDPAEFLKEMDKVRSSGFAVNRGEWRESVCGIASPIRNPDGSVIAAVGISGPVDRLKPVLLKSFASDVSAAAAAIGALISRG